MNPKSYRLLFSLLVAASLLLAGVLLVSAAPAAPAASKLTATPLSIVAAPAPAGNAEPWPYIVRLAGEPLATYRGGVARLQATSPRVTRQPRLNVESPASRAYLDYLTNRQTQFVGRLAQVVGHPVQVLHTYEVTYNGLAVVLKPAEAARVAGMRGVVSVRRDELKHILTDVTPDFIGATAIWDATAAGVDVGTRGEGVIVGVIDTGIWPEHPSFADDGTYPDPPEGWGGECTPPADDSASYTCNNKLIGVQYFLDTYDEQIGYDGLFHSGRDDDGHGTHTASTAAGNENIPATLLGVDRGMISGIAPRAHVAMYKALGPQGGFTSDLAAAIEKAVADGVDTINYSIGGGATDPWDDPDSLAFLAAREAGVFVATSAGNSGPDPDTIGSPANAPWVTAVGASTSNRHFISEITLSATDTAPVTLLGASVTEGVTDFDLVDAEGIPDREGDDSGLCLNPFSEGTFQATDVVLCKRGQIARVLRGDYVAAGGGGGVILYNPVQQGLATDNYVIPAVHVENDVGQQIKDFIAAHPDGVTVSFTGGTAVFGPGDPRVVPDMMASFSSRGPNGPVPAVIKPDVTAPGVQILAGASPEHYGAGAQGELFQAIQGTSMSSPHVAGAGALLMAVHPDWSPAELQSALMTTALTEVVKEDGETAADPFDLGGGRIDLARAADPGLVFDVSAADYEAGQDDPVNMNLPGLGFGNVAGVATITRTATSLVAVDSTWTVNVDAPGGVQITVSPDPLVVPANGTATFTVSVDATEVAEGQYFAHVYLEHGPHQVHMPVAFVNVPAVWNSLEGVKTQFDASSTDFNLESGVNVDPFAINAYGLVDPVRTAGGPLDQDPDQNPSTDPLGEGFELYPYTLASDTVWFVAQTRESEISDIDLFLLYDADGSGTFEWPDELIDASTSPSANEEVGVTAPTPGDYLVAVEAWAGSGTYTLKTYQVTTADDTLTLLDAPASIEAASNYTMQVAWDHQIDQGEEYLGAITMGDAEDPVSVGFAPVRVIGDVPAVQKSVSPDAVFTGDSLDYEIVLANADVQERQMDLSDAVPSNVTVDPASITGGATLDGGTITWSGTLPPASNAVEIGPSSFPFGYVSLASLGADPLDIGDPNLDDSFINLRLSSPVSYLGVEYDIVCMVTNGYLVLGGCTDEDLSFRPQNFPDSTPPNNVIAPLWMDFDLDGGDGVGGGTWYATGLSDGVSTWWAFEWEDAQRWGEEDTAFTFQVWLKVATEEVTLTYGRLDGSTAGAVVGAENADGTVGAVYYFNDGEGTEVGTFPTLDDILDVSGGFRPALHTITYSALAETEEDATNVATVTSGDDRDTDSASAEVTKLPPPPPGTYSLAARVFVDFRCDTYFISGMDRALSDVPVTLSFSNRARITGTTSRTGLVLFSSFDVTDPVTLTVDLPDQYRGRALGTCSYSDTVVTLSAGDFSSFGTRFVTIGTDVTGEDAAP